MAALRLFPVRWRSTPVHRKYVCADGSNADSGDDRAEVSIAAGGESSRGAAGVDHAAAAAWSACHAGVAGEKRSSVLIKRQASCRCRLVAYLPAVSGPSSERVCITRRIESRVTMPTIWGAPSPAPLTTGI